VLNKIDMVQDSADVVKKFVKDYGWKGRVFAISAISGMGCKELTYAIMDHLDEVKKARQEQENESVIINPI
jgi:GTP-binding protein